MIDYFAFLDQPRRPWLDPGELKQAFHARSRELHPDVADASDAAFAQLNEAYQVLDDPKRRLQHLLALEGRPPARNSSVPQEIAVLFPIVASVTQDADAVVQRATAATNPLSRSLLKPQMLAVQNRLAETLQHLRDLEQQAQTELQQLSTVRVFEQRQWAQLHALYLQFSYVGRWIAELEEKQLRLTNA